MIAHTRFPPPPPSPSLSPLRPRRLRRQGRRSAFTLLELLAVMAIVIVLLTLTLPSFLNWGRGTDIRTSLGLVRSTLTRARQRAMAHGTPVTFAWTNSGAPLRGSYHLRNQAGLIGTTNHLARGLTWATNDYTTLSFRSDGACGTNAASTVSLAIEEAERGTNGISRTITITCSTGYVDVLD